MPLDATTLARDLDAISGDYAGTITHNGASISGTVSPVEQSGEMDGDMAGVSGSDVFTFVGKASLFTAEPAVKDLVTYNGAQWLVVDITEDVGAYTLRLRKE